MGVRPIIVLGLSLVLAACGQANDAAYDAAFTESCKSSAMAAGVPEADATSLCGCALAKVNDRFSATEKLTLSDEQAQPIVAECLAERMQQ